MSRDGSGNYTLPTGNPVVSATTISSTWANDTLNDIATELTASLDRNGKGGMLDALHMVDGAVATPSLAWTNETTSGWYRASAGNCRFSILGADVLTVTGTGLQITDDDAGAAANPHLTLYRDSASPAASDVIGQVLFAGENDAAEQTNYSQVRGEIITATDGSEDGQLVVATMQAGTMTDVVRINEDGDLVLLDAGAGATAAPSMILYRDSASPAASDIIGQVRFHGENAAAEETPYASISTRIVTTTDAAEDGNLLLNTMQGGTLTIAAELDEAGNFTIIKDDDAGTQGPDLRLFQDSASPAAVDQLGRVIFDARNSAAEQITYAGMLAVLADPTDGAEEGKLLIKTMQAGALTNAIIIDEVGYVGVNVEPTRRLSVYEDGGGVSVGGVIRTATDGARLSFRDTDTANDTKVQVGCDNEALVMYSGGSEQVRVDSVGNVLVGGTTTPTSSVGNIVLYNGTAPSASATNGIVLYAEDVTASSELKVRDEGGTVTTLSPHNFSLIPEGPSEEMAWSHFSQRGERKLNVDMLKLARLVERLSGEKLVYEEGV